MMDADEVSKILNPPFTFSANCVVGLTPTYAPRCECWRCREQRGEPRDEELAAAVSIEARKAWNQWTGEFLKRKDGQP
jgi:hypothetical protein